MGPGILPETTVGKHNPPYHLQRPTKPLSCKKEAICEHGPEALSCPVGQGSFKKSKFDIMEITDVMSSGLKRRETFQCVISIQFKSQHLWWYGGTHKCIRYGQLACFGRHYECWKVYKGFRATYTLLQTMCISAGQCKTTYYSYYNSMAL